MAFSQDFLQELADRNPIEDVVGEYVALTKRSGQNLFGLCPFHSEKTPSFSVSPSKQIYHCFGCGKGGSVINFIMEIENLSFPEAVEFLARRAGMKVPEQNTDPGRPKRERMYALNRDAARFFYEQLSTPAGAAAVDYMLRRGITPATARRFGLGCAPDTWESLTSAMKQKGYTERELYDAGLVRRGRNGGVYDAFRNRLMFPVIDVRGNVIAFSGRILGDGEPKYLNSPETPVFSKSHNLFGLNLAKKSKSGYIILVEGNIDVVSLHQAGFDNAVASLGTSLTPEQARLISRYKNEVVIAYDADAAGQKASQRAIGILEKLELKVRVLTVKGAKDPDEFIKAKGAEAFQNLLAESENHVEYRLDAVKAKYDLATDEGKVGYLKDAAAVLAELPDRAAREVYAMRAASLCGVSPEAVQDEIKQLRRRKAASARRKDEREQLRPVRMSQPQAQGIRYENPRSAAAEQGVIRLLYIDPELFKNVELGEGDFSSKELWQIYSALRRHVDGGGKLSPAALSGELTAEEASLFTSLIQSPESAANGKRALADYIAIMREGPRNTASTPEELMELAGRMKKTKSYGG